MKAEYDTIEIPRVRDIESQPTVAKTSVCAGNPLHSVVQILKKAWLEENQK